MPDWLIGFLSCGGFVAFLEILKEYLAFRRKRKAEKEDRAEEKSEKAAEKREEEDERRMREMEATLKAVQEGVKLLLLDRILYLGEYYIEKGEITFDQRHRFHQMHDCYHDGLHGNGDADVVVELVDELPPHKR